VTLVTRSCEGCCAIDAAGDFFCVACWFIACAQEEVEVNLLWLPFSKLALQNSDLGHLLCAQQLATAKDQNAALRVACGELRQLLTMQKAVAADRFAAAASPSPAEPEILAPLQQTPRGAPPVTPDASLSAAASNPEKRHKAIQTEKGPGGREQLADRNKQITRLRAALAASERQRERQAAVHKQELEALQASLGQVGSTSFPLDLGK
jgi:hypothetical protein